MKDCKKIHPLLPLYSEKQLSPGERQKVEKHLSLCVEARKELEQLGGLIKALHQMPEPSVPADLHEKIMAKLGHNVTPFPKRQGWGMPAWALSAAAVLLFVLLNQYPNWHDTLRVNKSRQDQETAGGAPNQTAQTSVNVTEHKTSTNTFSTDISANKPAPASNLFKVPAAQNAGSGATANFQFKKSLPNGNATTDGYFGTEKDITNNSGLDDSLNQPASATAKLEAEAPKTSMALDESAHQASRAKKVMAAAEAPSEPAPLAISTPTVESLDKSTNLLTYSREENVTTWKGNNGPATVESQELVTDAETFQKYWNIPHPGEAPPTVDFTTEAVVVLMAGGKPTAGYSIYVSRLEEKADQLVIHYRVDAPAPDAVTAQILTNPWSLQVIPKPLKPVVFQKDN